MDTESTVATLEGIRDLFYTHEAGGGWRARWKANEHYELSIVAGEYFYSSPRRDLDDPMSYTEYEVAVIDAGGLCAPPEEFAGDFEPGESPVAGWMKPERIMELWSVLKNRAPGYVTREQAIEQVDAGPEGNEHNMPVVILDNAQAKWNYNTNVVTISGNQTGHSGYMDGESICFSFRHDEEEHHHIGANVWRSTRNIYVLFDEENRPVTKTSLV